MCVRTAGTGKTTAVVEIILQEVARGNEARCDPWCWEGPVLFASPRHFP